MTNNKTSIFKSKELLPFIVAGSIAFLFIIGLFSALVFSTRGTVFDFASAAGTCAPGYSIKPDASTAGGRNYPGGSVCRGSGAVPKCARDTFSGSGGGLNYYPVCADSATSTGGTGGTQTGGGSTQASVGYSWSGSGGASNRYVGGGACNSGEVKRSSVKVGESTVTPPGTSYIIPSSQVCYRDTSVSTGGTGGSQGGTSTGGTGGTQTGGNTGGGSTQASVGYSWSGSGGASNRYVGGGACNSGEVKRSSVKVGESTVTPPGTSYIIPSSQVCYRDTSVSTGGTGGSQGGTSTTPNIGYQWTGTGGGSNVYVGTGTCGNGQVKKNTTNGEGNSTPTGTSFVIANSQICVPAGNGSTGGVANSAFGDPAINGVVGSTWAGKAIQGNCTEGYKTFQGADFCYPNGNFNLICRLGGQWEFDGSQPGAIGYCLEKGEKLYNNDLAGVGDASASYCTDDFVGGGLNDVTAVYRGILPESTKKVYCKDGGAQDASGGKVEDNVFLAGKLRCGSTETTLPAVGCTWTTAGGWNRYVGPGGVCDVRTEIIKNGGAGNSAVDGGPQNVPNANICFTTNEVIKGGKPSGQSGQTTGNPSQNGISDNGGTISSGGSAPGGSTGGNTGGNSGSTGGGLTGGTRTPTGALKGTQGACQSGFVVKSSVNADGQGAISLGTGSTNNTNGQQYNNTNVCVSTSQAACSATISATKWSGASGYCNYAIGAAIPTGTGSGSTGGSTGGGQAPAPQPVSGNCGGTSVKPWSADDFIGKNCTNVDPLNDVCKISDPNSAIGKACNGKDTASVCGAQKSVNDPFYLTCYKSGVARGGDDKTCPPGTSLDSSGLSCVCPSGFTFDYGKSNTCIAGGTLITVGSGTLSIKDIGTGQERTIQQNSNPSTSGGGATAGSITCGGGAEKPWSAEDFIGKNCTNIDPLNDICKLADKNSTLGKACNGTDSKTVCASQKGINDPFWLTCYKSGIARGGDDKTCSEGTSFTSDSLSCVCPNGQTFDYGKTNKCIKGGTLISIGDNGQAKVYQAQGGSSTSTSGTSGTVVPKLSDKIIKASDISNIRTISGYTVFDFVKFGCRAVPVTTEGGKNIALVANHCFEVLVSGSLKQSTTNDYEPWVAVEIESSVPISNVKQISQFASPSNGSTTTDYRGRNGKVIFVENGGFMTQFSGSDLNCPGDSGSLVVSNGQAVGLVSSYLNSSYKGFSPSVNPCTNYGQQTQGSNITRVIGGDGKAFTFIAYTPVDLSALSSITASDTSGLPNLPSFGLPGTPTVPTGGSSSSTSSSNGLPNLPDTNLPSLPGSSSSSSSSVSFIPADALYINSSKVKFTPDESQELIAKNKDVTITLADDNRIQNGAYCEFRYKPQANKVDTNPQFSLYKTATYDNGKAEIVFEKTSQLTSKFQYQWKFNVTCQNPTTGQNAKQTYTSDFNYNFKIGALGLVSIFGGLTN